MREALVRVLLLPTRTSAFEAHTFPHSPSSSPRANSSSLSRCQCDEPEAYTTPFTPKPGFVFVPKPKLNPYTRCRCDEPDDDEVPPEQAVLLYLSRLEHLSGAPLFRSCDAHESSSAPPLGNPLHLTLLLTLSLTPSIVIGDHPDHVADTL